MEQGDLVKGLVCKFAMLFCLMWLAGCASKGGVPNAIRNTALPPPDAASVAKVYQTAAEYRIGAQDLLQITVLGVSDLDREVRVNTNGQISLPLIGGVIAGGKTIPELESAVAEKYESTYLQNPQVSVFVKEFTSQRLTLDGALNKPGIYALQGTTTLMQAIALAGGMDPLAQRDGVVIFRQVEGKKMAAVFDIDRVASGAVEDPQVYGDDIIMVNRSGSRSSLQELIKSAPLLTLFFLL